MTAYLIFKHRKIQCALLILILVLLSTASHATTLVRYDYVGPFYQSFRDDPTPSGSFSFLNQIRASFYVRKSSITDPNTGDFNSGRSFKQISPGVAQTAEIFGLQLIDGFPGRERVSLGSGGGLAPGMRTGILMGGSTIAISFGEVESWNLTLQTGHLDGFRTLGTPTFALLEDEQWWRIRTTGFNFNGRGDERSDIWECIENCSRTRTLTEVYGIDSGSTSLPVTTTAALSLAALSTAAEEPQSAWVRDSREYELLNDGSIIPQDIPPIPLPGAVWLFGSALLGLGAYKRRLNIK
ncbi:MAG: hypothetical protein AAF372_03395 [Pseudomonadota bacterium]